MITDRDPEFLGTITALYRDELGREPDPDGRASWLQWCREGDTARPDEARTGERLRALLHDSPEGVAYRARPIPPPVPHLEVRGRDFVDADGQRLVLNGLDQFCAYDQFLRGGLNDVLFDESKVLGFNLWRVFLTGSVAQNGILELRPDRAAYYEGLRLFADLLNQHGIVLLATVYVDNQDIKAGPDHWHRVADALRGSVTLLSGGNQWSKNGFNPGDLTDPGMLWSRGSDVGDAAPFQPHGSFAEFHPRRDLPAALMDTVASPVFIDKTLSAPLVISEPPRMGSNGSGDAYTDPFLCWKFARHYATECAGAVFHNANSMRGQVMDATTRACAAAWSKGMR